MEGESQTVELNYTKMRGAGFEPLQFELRRIEHVPALRDAKDRPIPTIRAVPITDTQAQAIRRTTREVEDRVLRAYLVNPEVTHGEICHANQWLDAKGNPLKSKVSRALGVLAKLGYMRKQRDDEWALTDKGKEEARKVALAASRIAESAKQERLL
jgi:hypothetical protein